MIDIDNFKKVNDTFGHQVGDHCLIHIADILKQNIRAADIVTPYGGEEFAILLPNTNLSQGALVAKQLCLSVASAPFLSDYLESPLKLTVSVGVASTLDQEKCTSPDIMKRADKALYLAKAQAKNRVSIAS